MKNSNSSKINHEIEKNQKFTFENESIKTTNINILLNRVRQENKKKSKKKMILLISIMGILSFFSIMVFGN